MRSAVALSVMIWLTYGTAMAETSHDSTDQGAALYKRCAVCHLSSGKGVPSSIPPLGEQTSAFMDKPDGRAYIVMVVSKGLSGPINVNGQNFRGFMPPQKMNDSKLAILLNYIAGSIIKPPADAAPFTADEIADIRKKHKSLTPGKVRLIRPADNREPSP